MNLQSTDKRPWYRELWPWLLMAGPTVVVIAGFITAWLAVRSNDGLVADDYYKQGLAINQQLQWDRKAGELGLQGEIMRSGMHLRILLTGGAPIAFPEKLTLRITHPTRDGMDQVLLLAMEGPGMFSGVLKTDIASGRWHVVLEDQSGQWRLRGEWQAESGESLRLSPS